MREYRDFENVEEVWFWFCASLIAQAEGVLRSRSDYAKEARICEVCDIHRILKYMKIDGVITNAHLRVMYKWGFVQQSPEGAKRAKISEAKLWVEGLKNFEPYLIKKRILINVY